MATVNFSVPQDIEEAFDKTFARRHKMRYWQISCVKR